MARVGTRLIDRPEFKTKPKPGTFYANDKVSVAVSVMSKKNYGSVIIVDRKDKVIGTFVSILNGQFRYIVLMYLMFQVNLFGQTNILKFFCNCTKY